MNNITRFFMWLIVGVVVVARTYITGSRAMILGLLVPAIAEDVFSNETTSLDDKGENLSDDQEDE